MKSMTGFGKGTQSFEKRNITVEIKSVNHRYCDINVRLNRKYSFAEEHIRNIAKENIGRGKVDIAVNIEAVKESDVEVNINRDIIAEYMQNIEEIQSFTGKAQNVTLEFLLQLPEVIKLTTKKEDEEEIIKEITVVLCEALEKFEKMRSIEGKNLVKDILKRGEMITAYAQEIEKRANSIEDIYRQRLTFKMQELLNGLADNLEEKIVVEAAFLAEKANITEELVRLKSHVRQMEDILNGGKAEGRKLDFILQEMNRETNTIGSKANDLGITKLMLEMKSEIEKIREQVQNIE